ncbi:MAG: hypothetical protein NVS4B11_34320 [Ktedonobacteraceae bacterium]
MQQIASQPQPNPNFRSANGSNSRSTIIVILALLLFALSGLMTGFATGAFMHTKQTLPQGNKDTKGTSPTAIVQKQTPNPSTTAASQVTNLGWPSIQKFTAIEKADGTTNYTFSAYPVDQSIDSGHGQQVHASDITCKMWLTKDDHANETLRKSLDKLRSIDSVRGVLPTEMENAFVFGTTPQTQMCNVDGSTTWTYTIATNVNQGRYFLMILADWKGTVFNWNAQQITITKAGD